jgi:hypothetical protein
VGKNRSRKNGKGVRVALGESRGIPRIGVSPQPSANRSPCDICRFKDDRIHVLQLQDASKIEMSPGLKTGQISVRQPLARHR